MRKTEVWVGMDVSKDSVDIYVRPTGERWHVKNQEKAFQTFLRKLKSRHPSCVVVEATGGYERDLVRILQNACVPVAVINPRQGRDFARALGQWAKTDRIDAEVLAHFAESLKPDPQEPGDPAQEVLKDQVTRRQQIVDMLTQEKNRLSRAPGALRQGIQDHIRWLDQQLRQIDQTLEDYLKAHPQWQQKCQIVESVPGVGPILGVTLLSQLPELGQLNGKQIALLVGVAPLNCDSGAWKGQRHVWGGRKAVRGALYMGTMSAIRFNPVIKAFYQRLRLAGKKGKVALIACMRKLLVILNSMVKHKSSWRHMETPSFVGAYVA